MSEIVKLKRELWWVYCNIIEEYGKFDLVEVEKRMNELRYGEHK